MANVQHNISFNINANVNGLQAATAAAAEALKSLQNASKYMPAATAKNMQMLSAAMEQMQLKQGALKQFGQLTQVVQKADAQVQAASAGLKLLQSPLKGAGQAASEAKRKYEDFKRSMQENKTSLTKQQLQAMKIELKDLREAWKEAERSAAAIGKTFSKAQSELLKQQKSLMQARQELGRQALEVVSHGGSTIGLASQQRQIQAEIQRTNAALERQAAIAQRQINFNRSYERVGTEYQNYQQALDTARTIMSPFTDAVQTSMDFEATMSTVKALTQSDYIKSGDLQKVNANMAKLTATAERLGATTKFTATEAAQGEVYLAYSGWDTDQINSSMEAVLNFAMAGNLDMANAARIMSNVMMAAKLAPEKSMHAADVLSYVVTHSNQDAFTLGETLKYSVPVAMQFGSSFEEAVAMTKPLADAGITGSMAGTSLRATMLRLIAPPKQAREAMEANSLTLDDATKEWANANELAAQYGVKLSETETSAGKQMASVLRQINENMSGLSSKERMAAFNAIVGRNAVSGAVNLFDWGSELVRDEETGEVITRLEEFTRQLEEGRVDGYAAQTAKVMTDNLKGDVTTLNSAYENMQIQIGRALSPALREATQFATGLVRELSNFIVQYPQVAQAAATIAAGISSMIVAGAGIKLLGAVAQFAGDGFLLLGTRLTGFFAGIPAALTAAITWLMKLPSVFMAALRAGLMFAFSPIGAAMMALALVAVAVYKNWDKVGPVFGKVAGIIQSSLSNALNTIGPAIERAIAAFQRLLAVIGSSGAGEMLAKGFVVALGVITGVFQAIMEMASHLIALLADVAKGAANITSALMEGDFSGALKASNELVTGSYKDLKGFAAATGGLVTNPYNNALTLLDEYEHGGERWAAETEKRRLEEYKAFLAEEQERHGAVEPSERLKERQAVFAERRAQEAQALKQSAAVDMRRRKLSDSVVERDAAVEQSAEKQAALKTALVQNAQVGAGYNTQAKSYVVADHSEVDLKNAEIISNWQPPEPRPEPRWQLGDSEYLRQIQRQKQYQAFNDSVRNALTFKGSQAPDDYNFNELQALEGYGAKWFQEFDFSKLLNNSLNAGLTAASSTIPQIGLSNVLDALSSIFFSKADAATPESAGATDQIQALGAAAQMSAESMQTNAQAMSSGLNENVQQAAQGMSTFGQEIGSMVTNMQSASEQMQPAAQAMEQMQPAAQAMEQMSLPAQQSAEALQELPASIETTNEALSQSTQTINESISNSLTALTESLSASLTTISESLNLAGETFSTSLTTISESLNLAGETFSTSLTTISESLNLAGETFSTSLTTISEMVNMAATALTESFNAANQETVALTAAYVAEQAAVAQSTAAYAANAAAVAQASAAANASAASLNSFTAAVSASVGGVSALSSASANAAGSVSMLGSAAAMAVASMNSAAANIASAAASLPAGSIAQNAKGGIYNHGAFLTWFAEKSPEAAIPLDGSDRAIGLWLQAGEMLGLEPAQNYSGGIYNRGGGKVNQSVSAIGDNFSTFESAVDNLLKASQILAKTDFAKVDNSAQMQTAKQSAAIVNPRQNQIPTFKEIMTPENVKSQRQMATTLQSARELAIPAEVKRSKSYQALQQVQRADVEAMTAPREVSYGNAIGKLLKGDILGAAKAGANVYKKNAEVKAGAAERALPATKLPQINAAQNEQAQASVKASSVSSESASKNATNAVKTMRSAGVTNEASNKTVAKHVGGIWGRWFGHKSHRYDELGNIKDLNGLPENVITASDSRAVVRDKKIAQEREASEKGFTRKHTGGIFGRMWNRISGGQSVGDALRNVIAPAQTAASIVTSDGRAQQLPMTPGTISQSKPSLIQKIMTPESVKSQQTAATTLNNARSAVMSDEVKQSRSYQALMQTQRADVNSMAAPREVSYGNAIGQLLKGDVWGAAKSAAGVYKNNLEIKAGAAERALPATALPQINAAMTTKLPPAGTVEQSKFPLYTMSQARVDSASLAQAQSANSLQQVDASAPHLEELTAFENETSQMGGAQTMGDMQVTFNVTINTQEAASAIPQIQDEFESKMREWLHERQRRGYR